MTSPTVADRIARWLPASPSIRPEPIPAYRPPALLSTRRVLFGCETFERHMTDEGHQFQTGLEAAGYELWGRYFDNDETDVGHVLHTVRPAVAIMQDKREWDANNPACFDKTISFENVSALSITDSTFRLTVVKDAHNDPEYHAAASREIGCHAWIVYYHPDIVCHLAPWVRREHVIRCYHTLNRRHLPDWVPAKQRRDCLISGAMSRELYPFRYRIMRKADRYGIDRLHHPGYNARGAQTPRFLRTLANYKVSICTASRLGYSLRKLIESTAAGCIVITDLPPDDPLPAIDGNLVRVHPDIEMEDLRGLINRLVASYDEERQRHFAAAAVDFYCHLRRGRELAAAIEAMRASYPTDLKR